jgi:hypothetical protein
MVVASNYSAEAYAMMDNRMKDNTWARLLAYVAGLVNQELLLRNEYLAAENCILRAHLPARLRLTDPERSTLVRGRRVTEPFRAISGGANDAVSAPIGEDAVSTLHQVSTFSLALPLASRYDANSAPSSHALVGGKPYNSNVAARRPRCR